MNGSVIRDYANSLQDRTYRFFKQVVDEGKKQVAEKDGYTEGGEIIVETNPTTVGASLSATGKGVLVIEFGAGMTVDSGHPYAGSFANVVSGGYSSTLGSGEFARTGKWHWHNQEFTAIAPRRGMLHASARMKKVIPKIAKRVFSAKR